MSDNVEQRLSAAFDARAAAVTAGPAPVQAIDARARQLTRRRWLTASSATVAAVAVVVVAGALTLGQNTNRPPTVGGAAARTGSPPSVIPTARPVAGTPTSGTAAALCGPWSAAGSTFADVVQAYGGIESCFRYDGATVAWVITTDGTAAHPGVVGIDWCTDGIPACLNGSLDHTNDLWTYYPAPTTGSIRLYAQPQAGHPLALTVGGKQQSFDPATATFADIAAAQAPSARAGTLVTGIVMAGGPHVPVGTSPSPFGYSSGEAHLSRGGRIVAEAYLESQPWQLSLAPGTYTLTSASCLAATTHIQAGTTTHTDITCNVP